MTKDVSIINAAAVPLIVLVSVAVTTTVVVSVQTLAPMTARCVTPQVASVKIAPPIVLLSVVVLTAVMANAPTTVPQMVNHAIQKIVCAKIANQKHAQIYKKIAAFGTTVAIWETLWIAAIAMT